MLASLSPQCSSSCCNTGSEFPLLSELKTIKRHRVPHNQLVLCRKGSDVRLLSPELLPSPGSVFPCSPWTHPLLAESHSSNNSLHGSFCLQIFLTSLMILFMVTPTTGFILPLQSPELFQVSAMISLPFSLANFVSLAVASH